jgi:hypothetical protein
MLCIRERRNEQEHWLQKDQEGRKEGRKEAEEKTKIVKVQDIYLNGSSKCESNTTEWWVKETFHESVATEQPEA